MATISGADGWSARRPEASVKAASQVALALRKAAMKRFTISG